MDFKDKDEQIDLFNEINNQKSQQAISNFENNDYFNSSNKI